MCVALSRCIAVGMPIGRSFCFSVGSLCRQNSFCKKLSRGCRDVSIVNRCWRLLLITGSFDLTRSISASMELVCIPVPLFQFDFWMVSHIFPGILRSCMFGSFSILVGNIHGGIGSG